MHILPQGQHSEEEINCSVSDFISTFKVGNLLRKCNAEKQKGIPVINRLNTWHMNISLPLSSTSSLYSDVVTRKLRAAFMSVFLR